MARSNLVIILLSLTAAGCHRPIQPAEPTSQHILVADATDADRLWESAQEILRRHRFELDRVDRRSGTIITYPQTSQSFFEFWRHDVDTGYDLMESTLRTVRRSVVVNLEDGRDGGEGQVTVTVRRETFATPERQINNSASVLRVFGDELPGVQGERRLTRADDYWIDDGRDAAMEQRLLRHILNRAVVSTAPES